MGEIYLADFGRNVDVINHELGHLIHSKRTQTMTESWYRQFRGIDYDPSKPITELGMLHEKAKGYRGKSGASREDFDSVKGLARTPVVISKRVRRRLRVKNLEVRVCDANREEAKERVAGFLRTIEEVPTELRTHLGEVNLFYATPSRRVYGFHLNINPTDAHREVSEDIAVHVAGFHRLYRLAQQSASTSTEVRTELNRTLSEELLQARAWELIQAGLLPEDFFPTLSAYQRHLFPDLEIHLRELLPRFAQKLIK